MRQILYQNTWIVILKTKWIVLLFLCWACAVCWIRTETCNPGQKVLTHGLILSIFWNIISHTHCIAPGLWISLIRLWKPSPDVLWCAKLGRPMDQTLTDSCFIGDWSGDQSGRWPLSRCGEAPEPRKIQTWRPPTKNPPSQTDFVLRICRLKNKSWKTWHGVTTPPCGWP